MAEGRCTMLGHVWMVVVNGAGHPQVVVCEVCGRSHLVGITDDHELCDRQLRQAWADADRLAEALSAAHEQVETLDGVAKSERTVSRAEWDEPPESEAGTLAALAAHAEAVASRG